MKLTKHPPGSVKEVFSISMPLMLSVFSSEIMMFIDRMILANFSTASMNGAAAAGMFAMIFIFGATGIASIAEVFVGQYNGAKEYDKVASPVWQMVWFSILTSLFFIPIGLFGGNYLLPDYHLEEVGIPYFKYMMLFSPFFTGVAALSSFFVGIGKGKIVLLVTVIGNLLNCLLDFLFIFGWKSIPSMGAQGAALATGFAQVVQLVMLFIFFLRPHLQKVYHTSKASWDFTEFVNCLKVGGPSTMGYVIEFVAWALLLRLVADVSEDHLTVMAVGQSFYSLIIFASFGLHKGVVAVTANYLGAKEDHRLISILKSAVKLLALFSLLIATILILYPDPFIAIFLAKETPIGDVIRLTGYLKMTCFFVWCYFILDGLSMIANAMLTAAKDTLFLMFANGFNAWAFAWLPCYLFVVKWGIVGPAGMFGLYCLFGIMNIIVGYTRLYFTLFNCSSVRKDPSERLF